MVKNILIKETDPVVNWKNDCMKENGARANASKKNGLINNIEK